MNLQDISTPVAYIFSSDRERTLAFYRDVLDAPVRSSDAFGDFVQLGGALLRVTVMKDFKGGPHPLLGWNVDDLAAVAPKLRERGVEFIMYEGMGQDAHGIWTGPDGKTKLAWFADPDGNVLSLSQA